MRYCVEMGYAPFCKNMTHTDRINSHFLVSVYHTTFQHCYMFPLWTDRFVPHPPIYAVKIYRSHRRQTPRSMTEYRRKWREI